MIKFFRKIRQELLARGKTGQYLKYAIGEIILVVLGILIALQINNWNEARKAAAFELQLLQSFKDGLQQDLQDIEGNIMYHRRGIDAGDTLLYYLTTDHPNETARIARLFADFMTISFFLYSTSAFETLKSQGITSISSEELRNAIIGVYDSQYNFFLKFQDIHIAEIERGYKQVFSSRFDQAYNYDLNTPDFAGAMRPLDFEALKTDHEFLYYVRSLKNRSVILVDWQYARLKSRITEVIGGIDEELAKK